MLAALDLRVRRSRLFQREIFSERNDAEQLVSILLQPREIHLRQLSRRNPARANQLRKLRHGRKGKILDRLELRRLNFAETKLRLVNVELFARARWVESDRGLSVERDVDLSDCFVRVEVAVDATERHRFLRVSELDSDQLFRLVHHFFGDARCWGRRRTGRRRRSLCQNINWHLRRRQTGGTKRGKHFEKLSSTF